MRAYIMITLFAAMFGSLVLSADEAEADEEDENPDKGLDLPSYDVVKARSKDISSLIARNRKLAGLERAVASSWRSLALDYKKRN